jgi:DNA replication protein DnaC
MIPSPSVLEHGLGWHVAPAADCELCPVGKPPMQPLGAAIGTIRERFQANMARQGYTLGPIEPEPEACGTCHDTGWVRRDLDPGSPGFGESMACGDCGVVTRRRVERMWGDLPEHYRPMRLNTYPRQIPDQQRLVRDLAAWLDDDQARWLYLHGASGRGKSCLTAALIRELINRGQSGLFRVVADVLERSRRTFRSQAAYAESESDLLKSLYDVDVLALDDIGAEKSSDWVAQELFQVVGHRYDHRKRTLFTSNLNLAELADHLGHPRVPSRIRERALIIDMSSLPNLRVD